MAPTTLPRCAQVSRAVKSAMAATKPMLSADEAAAMAGSCPSSLQAQEQLLLDSFVSLLLEGRYFPLSAQEWAVAQRQQFTFGGVHVHSIAGLLGSSTQWGQGTSHGVQHSTAGRQGVRDKCRASIGSVPLEKQQWHASGAQCLQQ